MTSSMRQRITKKLSKIYSLIEDIEDELLTLEDADDAADAEASSEIHDEGAEVSDDLLSAKQVCKLIGISESTFYLWISRGMLPKGTYYGAKSRRWKRSEIIK